MMILSSSAPKRISCVENPALKSRVFAFVKYPFASHVLETITGQDMFLTANWGNLDALQNW